MAEWRYTVEGEKLTMGEIVARVIAAHPTLMPSTIRKRVNAGLREWTHLTRPAAVGSAQRRAAIRLSISRAYRK